MTEQTGKEVAAAFFAAVADEAKANAAAFERTEPFELGYLQSFIERRVDANPELRAEMIERTRKIREQMQ